jgi:methionyl aminopeptidase
VIIRKGAAEIERIGRAGDLVARTISEVGEHLEPGITTVELDEVADAFIRANGGIPTSLGYRGYPRAICISVNEVVVHGIPDGRVVGEGDLVTVDVGVTLDGAIADSAYTFGVGTIDAEAQRLLDVCQDALAAGIGEARLGHRVGDISHAVQSLVEAAGFSVVKSLVGHGVGRHYHEDPHVPNFGEPGRGPRLSEGMTIAIEPMITMGDPDVVLADDGWTISSRDGSLAAHFEHTVAILPDGPRILTPRIEGHAGREGREGRGGGGGPPGGERRGARLKPRPYASRNATSLCKPQCHVPMQAPMPRPARLCYSERPAPRHADRARDLMNTHDGQGGNPARGVRWRSRKRRSRSRARWSRPCRARCSASSSRAARPSSRRSRGRCASTTSGSSPVTA